jgi:hypothetical protein
MDIVRGNNLLICGSFWSRACVQPTSATMTLRYRDLQEHVQTAVVNLAYNTETHKWTGSWDTSVAGPCRVDWVVQSAGALLAAAEGNFNIVANLANGATPDCHWACGEQFGG